MVHLKTRRTNLVVDDGAAFVKEADEKYDVVIVDSCDPVGPATVLFSEAFYSDIHNLLNPDGILVCQTGSLHMQPDEQVETHTLLSGIYGHAKPYVFAVPTYIGGLFSAMFCSDRIEHSGLDMKSLEKKMSANNIETKYYNPGMHIGAFHVPGFLKEPFNMTVNTIEKENIDAVPSPGVTFGWELVLDLYGCDQEKISDEKTIKKFARELCRVIDMKPYGEPQTPYFGENQEHTKGYSLLQFIETSSIVGHFSEGTGAVYLNIFSCKEYDIENS